MIYILLLQRNNDELPFIETQKQIYTFSVKISNFSNIAKDKWAEIILQIQ